MQPDSQSMVSSLGQDTLDRPADTANTKQFITFTIDAEEYGIDIMVVREIKGWTETTPIPKAPSHMRGVINLRGAVVPVIDLSVRFGKPASPVTKRTCIVIIEIEASGERHILGVVVDAVNAVLDIPASEIEPPPAFGARIRTDFIQGMGKVNGKFVVLLDVDHVLAIEEMQVLTDVQDAAATSEAA